jgi:hypothetical protein
MICFRHSIKTQDYGAYISKSFLRTQLFSRRQYAVEASTNVPATANLPATLSRNNALKESCLAVLTGPT